MDKPLRLFIAIELSVQIQQALTELIEQLKQKSGHLVKWVQPQQLHLTLKFLGDTPQGMLPRLNAQLGTVAAGTVGFELTAKSCGVFPTPNRARVLWAGISCPPELTQLQKEIDAQLLGLGFAMEGRAFSPHLTLGRVSDSAEGQKVKAVVQELLNHAEDDFGSVAIQKFTLFQSTLTPAGPIYTPLQRYALQTRK